MLKMENLDLQFPPISQDGNPYENLIEDLDNQEVSLDVIEIEEQLLDGNEYQDNIIHVDTSFHSDTQGPGPSSSTPSKKKRKR